MIKEIEIDYSQIESIELIGEMETIDICVEVFGVWIGFELNIGDS